MTMSIETHGVRPPVLGGLAVTILLFLPGCLSSCNPFQSETDKDLRERISAAKDEIEEETERAEELDVVYEPLRLRDEEAKELESEGDELEGELRSSQERIRTLREKKRKLEADLDRYGLPREER